ncbi:MAG: SGNH/GDSL hydrolase family protein [Armatimonadota bacterium]
MPLVKKVLFPLTSIALGALLAFGVAEVGLRLFNPQMTGPAMHTYDPRTGSRPVPNLRGRFNVPGRYSFTFTNDALGMRVTGVVPRETAKTRILLLGDSYAYGVGVNDHETFAYLLEERLSKTPLRAAVMNAGTGGKGTDYALRFFETIGRDLRPDLTILCFFSNDYLDNEASTIYSVAPDGTLHPRPDLGAVYRRKEIFRRNHLYNWLISWSHVASFGKQVAIGFLKAKATQEHEWEKVYPERGDGWANETNKRLTRIYLDRLAAAVREAGSDFLVVYAPGADEVDHFRRTGQISKDEATLASLLSANRGTLVSLTRFLAGSGRPISALYYDEAFLGLPGGHWTAGGHALATEYLEGPVKDRLARRLGARASGQ